MKNKFRYIFIVSACIALLASSLWAYNQMTSQTKTDTSIIDSVDIVDSVGIADSIITIDEPTIKAYPDTMLSSAQKIDFRVDTFINAVSGDLERLTDFYKDAPGILTFRGSPSRNMPFSGTVNGTPSKVKVEWVFYTSIDTTRTSLGVWHGGTGWTGQPLLAVWNDEQLKQIQTSAAAHVTKYLSNREVIVGSLCGKVYFIDYVTGKESRTPYSAGNTIKGTLSLDPTYCGNLYIGHGVPVREPFGALIVNLYDHRRVDTFGRDSKAWRRWGA